MTTAIARDRRIVLNSCGPMTTAISNMPPRDRRIVLNYCADGSHELDPGALEIRNNEFCDRTIDLAEFYLKPDCACVQAQQCEGASHRCRSFGGC
jgi:hypothetical protein